MLCVCAHIFFRELRRRRRPREVHHVRRSSRSRCACACPSLLHYSDVVIISCVMPLALARGRRHLEHDELLRFRQIENLRCTPEGCAVLRCRRCRRSCRSPGRLGRRHILVVAVEDDNFRRRHSTCSSPGKGATRRSVPPPWRLAALLCNRGDYEGVCDTNERMSRRMENQERGFAKLGVFWV